MKRTSVLLLILSVLIIIGTSSISSVQSSGTPPTGRTGATGTYCNACHTGNALNTAGGSVVATGIPSTYVLGTAYPFSVTITHAASDRKRWGFAIKAVNANGVDIGTFTTTNVNTSVGSGELRHLSAPVTTSINTYTFNNLNWTAPATNTLANKTVRFYLVGVAANNAAGNGGDFVYSNLITTPIATKINSFTPTKSAIGGSVTIKGYSFTSATSVSFGGTAANTFNATTDSTIIATLANGATGSVSVTSPNGTASLAGFTFCDVTPTSQSVNLFGCNSLVYNGTTYTTSTIKKDTIRTTQGCDSIYKTANITIKTITATNQSINLSGCDSVVYNGITYTTSTAKKDTIRTTQGCDSIYKVANILVKKASASYHSATICANSLPYIWNGNSYNTAGNYTVHFTNAAGCDSSANLKLVVNKTPVISLASASNCLSTANLNLSGANNALQIVWQNNGTTVNTITPTAAAFGTTVAGGNPTSTLPNAFNGPSSVFVDKNGVLYVGDLNNARIQRFAVGNLNATTVAGGYGIGVGLNQFNSPSGVMVNDSNQVYVGDFGNHRVTKWLPSATAGILVAGGNGSTNTSNAFNGVADVFIDAANNIYVADQNNHRIQKWAPGAASGVTVAGGNGAGSANNQINLPTAVFVDAAGNVYVGDYGNRRVSKWSVGATSGVTVAGGNGAGSANNQIDLLAGLFVDAIGNVYVADQNNHRIQKWMVGATSGVTVAGGNGAGSNGNQFNYPKDVYIDTSGAMYIPDNWNHRVQKWLQTISTSYIPTTAGSYTAIVTGNNGCVATSNAIVISSNVLPTINIVSNKTSVCYGAKVTFDASIANGGSTPLYQWKKNGSNVGVNSATYKDSTLNANDSVWCVLTSNVSCATSATAKSNVIKMSVTPSATTQSQSLFGCNSLVYNGKTYTASTIKRDTLRTTQGCDSIYKVANITIKTITASNQSSTISGCDKVSYKTIFYSTNATVKDTFRTQQGCDSVYMTVNINVKPNIRGNIIHPTKGGIKNVNIVLNGDTIINQISSTNYSLNCLANASNGMIRLSKNNDVNKINGVSGIDALLVTSHILNKTRLNSPYKIIAADVNNNKTVTNIDIIFMKRLILGLDTTYTGGRLWAFVDSSYVFPDTTNPFPFKDSINFTNLTSSKNNQTFIGVKLGDVNYDWNAGLSKGVIVAPIELVAQEKLQANVLERTVDFSVHNFKNIAAMQYTLHFDNNRYEFLEIKNNKLGIEFNAAQANQTGNIAMLWTDKNAAATTLKDGSNLFTLVLKEKNFSVEEKENNALLITLNNSITAIEAWDNNLQQVNIVLKENKAVSNNVDFIANTFVMYPNPAKNIVTIKSSGAKQLFIFNSQGKKVYQQKIDNNMATVNLNSLLPGLYLVQLINKDETYSNKKLVIE